MSEVTHDDVEKLRREISKVKNNNAIGSAVKTFVGFCLTAALGIAGWSLMSTVKLSEQVVKVNSNMEHLTRSVIKNSEALSAPRFTQENFDRQVKPLVDVSNKIANSLQEQVKTLNEVISTQREIKRDIDYLRNQ